MVVFPSFLSLSQYTIEVLFPYLPEGYFLTVKMELILFRLIDCFNFSARTEGLKTYSKSAILTKYIHYLDQIEQLFLKHFLL